MLVDLVLEGKPPFLQLLLRVVLLEVVANGKTDKEDNQAVHKQEVGVLHEHLHVALHQKSFKL